MSVCSVSSYSREFHEVALIFTACCVLLRSFMSAVSRISSSVEVSVQAYRELNTGDWRDPHGGSKPWSCLNKEKQWHIQHAKQSTDLVRKQLHCGARTNKGVINLNIELERQKLDQIDARNIRTSLRQTYSFPEVKLQQSLTKPDKDKYDTCNSSNQTAGPGARHNIECK